MSVTEKSASSKNPLDASLQSSAPEVDETADNALLKWAGGGFALLTGLLTFFGIKEGVLTRVVHDNPVAAMGILLFLGAGVLLATVAPSLKVGDGAARAPLWFLLFTVVVLMLVTEWLSEDFRDLPWSGQFNTAKIALTVVSLAVVVLLRFTSLKMPWTYAFAVLAVALVSAGLYVAAKISVLDTAQEGGVSVTATFDDAKAPALLTVKGSGGAVYGPVHVRVGDGAKQEFGSALFTPDRAGKLEGSAGVLVPAGVERVVVSTCEEDTQATDSGPCASWAVQATLPVPRAPARVAAWVAPVSATELEYKVEAYGVLPGRTYKVVMASNGATGSRSESLVAAKDDGTFTMSGKVTPAKAQVWTLSGVFCEAACGTPNPLATYTASK